MADSTMEAPRWCKGCGDFGILSALKNDMAASGIAPEQTVHVSGIGCSGRVPNYINSYGAHTLHGRAIPFATGLILTRPELQVYIESGDGDALSIGGNHLLHGINKNVNCVFVLFNNELYALTKSQTSPTTRQGHPTNTQPDGTWLPPINPLRIVLGFSPSFVANTADWMSDHLAHTLAAAREHQGFSFVHVFQRCPHYDPNAFNHRDRSWPVFLTDEAGIPPDKRYKDAANEAHDPTDYHAAMRLADSAHTHFGLIYKDADKPRYDSILQAAASGSAPESELLAHYRL